MITDKLFIDIVGDQKRGESLIRFAMKKLYELPQVRGQNTSRKIQLSGGEIVFVQHTDVRQEIRIFIPGGGASKKTEKKYEVANEFGLFVFWGMPWEVLTVSKATKKFLPREAVVCGDGSGNTWLVQGNKLIGQYVKCWEAGDTVKGMQSKAQAIIDACNRLEYQYTYTSYSLWSNFIFKAGRLISSPADIFKRMCRDNRNREFRTHTKVLGNPYHGWMTLTAVETQDLAQFGLDMRFWFLCAKYNGRQVTFDGRAQTELFTRGIMAPLASGSPCPILFDIFLRPSIHDEESEVFFAGVAIENFLIIWEFDSKEDDFKCIGHQPLDFTPMGYYELTVYEMKIIIVGGQLRLLEVAYTYAVSTKSGIKLASFDSRDHGPVEKVLGTLWNHFNNKIYTCFLQPGKPVETREPRLLIECVGISQWVTGIWYECWYLCSGAYSSCSCWVCSDPSTACRGPNSFEVVEGSRTIYDETFTWNVPIACCEDHAGNVMTFWTTYHEATYIPRTIPHVFPTLRISNTSFEISGGHIVIEPIDYKFLLADGVYSKPLPTEDEWHCDGEGMQNNSAEIKAWVFDTDRFYFHYKTQKAECARDHIAYSDIEDHIGDRSYAKFNSYNPWDHNWTLIIKEGTEDIDGKPISPALFYTDADGEEPKVYYDTGGGLRVAGPGNRAFCCADISTMRREVK